MFHYLYKITNLINNKIYVGRHSTERIDDGYMGGGTHLHRAYKKYGIHNFNKEILNFYDSYNELCEAENQTVNEDFINRKDTYNLVIGGFGGLGKGYTVVEDSNGKRLVVNSKDPKFISGEYKSITLNKAIVIDKTGKKFKIDRTDPRFILGEVVGHTVGRVSIRDKNNNYYMVDVNDPRYLSGELVSLWKDRVTVKDKFGKILQVSIDDPRYLSGELVGHSKGNVIVRGKDNKCFYVSLTDPRYLSGELIPASKNYKHTDEAKQKMRNAIRKIPKYEDTRSFNMIWIHNTQLKINKHIDKIHIDTYINDGWIIGKNTKYYKVPFRSTTKIIQCSNCKKEIESSWYKDMLCIECQIKLKKTKKYCCKCGAKRGGCKNPKLCKIFHRFMKYINDKFGFDLSVVGTEKYYDEIIRIQNIVKSEVSTLSVEDVIKKYNIENKKILKSIIIQLKI